MADPYNPYTSYSTPTPGGVSYYPPEEQSPYHQQPGHPYQQPYGTAEPQPDPNYTYAAQPSSGPGPYHLAPEPYQGGHPEQSHTPVGQPDYMSPATTSGMPPVQGGKIPENLGYYGHPADQPRYTPSLSPHPPSVHISEADNAHYHRGDNRASDEDADPGSERGIGSSLAGGAAGYYFGHKKNHGLLGAIGGAIVSNFLEDKLKDHGRHSHEHRQDHGHHHIHGHHQNHGDGHHHHHHHHRHSHSRSHSRHRDEDDL
ncbi:uncharacterized protein N7482_005699 [Penicillium canariense]|uniref:Glycine zipper 2TM domain-containing protein n=1 Tax=Penicillium canariense TaxID=189055 RepID=A0A9W9I538_9EURO|nr:uncharacterized protein N7482_005699 [Penicillium canariense]KAJ5166918.1 hypothetical protein N7482_005699 [Penicillium canariense]